jgi:hypothetical protein
MDPKMGGIPSNGHLNILSHFHTENDDDITNQWMKWMIFTLKNGRFKPLS